MSPIASNISLEKALTRRKQQHTVTACDLTRHSLLPGYPDKELQCKIPTQAPSTQSCTLDSVAAHRSILCWCACTCMVFLLTLLLLRCHCQDSLQKKLYVSLTVQQGQSLEPSWQQAGTLGAGALTKLASSSTNRRQRQLTRNGVGI